MFSYTFNKIVKADKLRDEVVAAGLSSLSYVETVENTVNLYFTTPLTGNEEILLSTKISSHTPSSVEDIISAKIKASITFGQKAMIDFATQNILLGITSDGKTGEIIDKLSGIVQALQTGSLYDAITRARQIPPEHYDSKYITEARLLNFVNKIEDFLQIPRSSSL